MSATGRSASTTIGERASPSGPAASPPLWQLLQTVAQCLQAVRQGQSTSRVLPQVAAHRRAAVQSLLFRVLRQLGVAQALRQRLAPRAPAPAADALLCTSLALCWNEAQAPYDVHTLVNQAVEAAKQSRRTQGQAAFINACLRRFLREREALVARTEGDFCANARPCWPRCWPIRWPRHPCRPGGCNACNVITPKSGQPWWNTVSSRHP